ncbi:uncharacterized protein METZ01_LOCUS333573, partial [marine metagenome]
VPQDGPRHRHHFGHGAGSVGEADEDRSVGIFDADAFDLVVHRAHRRRRLDRQVNVDQQGNGDA